MYISELAQRINHKLAGANISQTEIIGLMDGVIDDINTKLNSRFPTYSEAIRASLFPVVQEGLPPDTPITPPIPDTGWLAGAANIEYTAIPDKYQRSVVIVGSAIKYYEADEEGNQSAVMFRQDYDQALFYMQRDFSFSIPECYRECDQGFVSLSDEDIEAPGMRVPNNPFNSNIRFR